MPLTTKSGQCSVAWIFLAFVTIFPTVVTLLRTSVGIFPGVVSLFLSFVSLLPAVAPIFMSVASQQWSVVDQSTSFVTRHRAIASLFPAVVSLQPVIASHPLRAASGNPSNLYNLVIILITTSFCSRTKHSCFQTPLSTHRSEFRQTGIVPPHKLRTPPFAFPYLTTTCPRHSLQTGSAM
jgi:hypothetical protein